MSKEWNSEQLNLYIDSATVKIRIKLFNEVAFYFELI